MCRRVVPGSEHLVVLLHMLCSHDSDHRRHPRRVLALVGTPVLLLVSILIASCGRFGSTTARPRSVKTVRAPSIVATSPASVQPIPMQSQIGTSRQGRPIGVVSFGSGSRRVLIIGGIHGNEYGTAVASALVAELASHPGDVPAGSTVDIVPCANPDGLAAQCRPNAAGVDINGNFPVGWSRHGAPSGESAGSKAASEPETQALMSLLAQRRYSAVIALHSAAGLIDFDGPGGQALARRIAGVSGLRVVHLAGLHTYSGSMGQYVPKAYGIPVVTWELRSRSLDARTLAGLTTAMQ